MSAVTGEDGRKLDMCLKEKAVLENSNAAFSFTI